MGDFVLALSCAQGDRARSASLMAGRRSGTFCPFELGVASHIVVESEGDGFLVGGRWKRGKSKHVEVGKDQREIVSFECEKTHCEWAQNSLNQT